MMDSVVHEQLDQAIDMLVSGHEPHLDDPELTELLALGARCRELPRPGFKGSLKAALQEKAASKLRMDQAAEAAWQDRRLAREIENILPSFVAGPAPTARRGHTFAASAAAHFVFIALFVWSGLSIAHLDAPTRGVVDLVVTDSLQTPHLGGGGGGARERTEASKGDAARSIEQLAVPVITPPDQEPKVELVPSVIADAKAPAMPQLGDPSSSVVVLSNGTGRQGGIGGGSAGGIGPGTGPGIGPGANGGIGGGIYRVSGGVTAPVAIYSPEPLYTEEARKVKHQGTVLINAVIGPDGRPRNLRVTRALGMGLDQKALEAVEKWRFKPSTLDGKPVAVLVTVEVNFRLY
jgi:TonB family protein